MNLKQKIEAAEDLVWQAKAEFQIHVERTDKEWIKDLLDEVWQKLRKLERCL